MLEMTKNDRDMFVIMEGTGQSQGDQISTAGHFSFCPSPVSYLKTKSFDQKLWNEN